MDRILASLIFFTRLPLWKVVNPPQKAYSDVVVFWPLTGWLTGGLTALTLWGESYILPWPVAIILAISLRLLLTGALHEDGLADFCDGFGAGGDKTQILAIMKDSHIGTYGVIGLIIYFLLYFAILMSLPIEIAALGVFSADAFGKCAAAQITNILPYARPEGAKNKISYTRMSAVKILLCLTAGVAPLCFATFLAGWRMIPAAVLPIIMLCWLTGLMRKKLGGYTGDCCGASFLLIEISFLLGLAISFTAL